MPHKRNPIGSENMTGLAQLSAVTWWHANVGFGTNVIFLTNKANGSHQIRPSIDHMPPQSSGNIVKNPDLVFSQKTWSATWTQLFGLILVNVRCWPWGHDFVNKPYDLVQPKTLTLGQPSRLWTHFWKPTQKCILTPDSRRNRWNLQPSFFTTLNVLMKSLNVSVWVTNHK